jgi:AraC family transcriptional regulator, transcriptional activator FtrA
MHRVAIPVTAGIPLFELAVPCEVFGGSRQDFPVPWWYEVQLCAAQDGPVRTAERLLFDGALGLDELSQADTVIVPACADTQGDPPQALLQALRAAYDRGARIASICTGAFTLAAAGLLDGRRAATHWMHAAELARRWPAVRVEPDVLYTDDGQILTSAGASAGLDLCLHIVRQDHGTRIANALARRLVIPPHREGGQAQYIEQPVPIDGSPSLGPCLDWARAHLDLPLTVEDLARQALMSPAPSPGGSVRRPGQRHCDGCAPNGSAVRKTSWRTPTTPSTGSQIPAASDPPTDCAPTSPGSTT